MTEGPGFVIVMLLAGAWLLQIWLSSRQMRRFHADSQRLRKLGKYMAIGLAGTTYRRKVYTALAVDDAGKAITAIQLGGFTVFARSRTIEGIAGMPLEQIGQGEPPPEISQKTWASLDHAAGFIRKKFSEPVTPKEVDP